MTPGPGLQNAGRRRSEDRVAKWVAHVIGEAATERLARVFLRPVAVIVFVPSPWVGALMWLAIAQTPVRAGAAVIGLLLAEALCLVLRKNGEDPQQQYLRANALLASLAVAWLIPPTEASLLQQLALVGIAAMVASVLAAALSRALGATGLPTLVWGYCAVASVLFTTFPEWTAISAATIDWHDQPAGALDWITVFLRSLGTFLFVPGAWTGLIIAVAIFLWSRASFLAGLTGWIAGALVAQLLAGLAVEFVWQPVAYNFFIAGMGLGAVFFLPGWSGLAIAAGAGAIAAFGTMAFQYATNFSPIAWLPVPFATVLWVGILSLRRSRPDRVQKNLALHLPPEEAVVQAALEADRWGRDEALLMVPVYGEAEITQGFHGRHSHAGRWCHALDFQRPAAGSTLPGGATSIMGDLVLAPAPGVIERIENAVPDNKLGVSNFADNWGNHVIIRLDTGGWAMIAHLAQGSVALPVGTRVDYGTVIGRAGNSGRSPVPHVHLQVQRGPAPGAPTLPFQLANFLWTDRPEESLTNWKTSGIPDEGTRVSMATPNPASHQLLAGMAPGTAHWSITTEGNVPSLWSQGGGLSSLRVDIALDSAGQQILQTSNGGTLTARYDVDAWRVVHLDEHSASLLRLIALALPSVPYCAIRGLKWTDTAPVAPVSSFPMVHTSLAPYFGTSLARVRLQCVADCANQSSKITVETHKLDPVGDQPNKLRAEISSIKGLSGVVAYFEDGTVSCSLYSFTPRASVLV